MHKRADFTLAFLLTLGIHTAGGVVCSRLLAPERGSAAAPAFKPGESSLVLEFLPAGEPEVERRVEEVVAPPADVEEPARPEPARQPMPDAPAMEMTAMMEPAVAAEAPVTEEREADSDLAMTVEEPVGRGPGGDADVAMAPDTPAGEPGMGTPAENPVGENPDAGVETVAACDVDIRPRYPLGSRLRGEEGTVTLKIRVGAKGRAEDIKVATPSGYTALDRAAVSAVWRASFTPRADRTKPYGDILVSIRFQLTD